jgi:hypothetical protein
MRRAPSRGCERLRTERSEELEFLAEFERTVAAADDVVTRAETLAVSPAPKGIGWDGSAKEL